MISPVLTRSHNQLFENDDAPFDVTDPVSTFSPSFFSDYIHYLTKSTKIPKTVHNIIFFYLLFQILAVSYVPKIVDFWDFNPYLKHLFNIILYVSLIKPAPYNSESFDPIFITLIVIIFLEVVISLSVRFYFDKHRYAPKIWCYCSRYISIITSTIFFPLSTSFCAEYLNATFSKSKNDVSEAMAFLVLIVQLLTLVRSAGFLTLVHHTIPYSEMIFKVHRPFSVTRVYLSLVLCVFVEDSLTITKHNYPLIHILLFLVMLINFLLDLMAADWANETELKWLTSITFASSITSLIFIIDSFLKDSKFHDCIIWATFGADFFIIIIVPYITDAISSNACKRLSELDYAAKVSSSSRAVRDHYIGFRCGQKDVLKCTHINDLLNRFPNDLRLYILCARLNLVLKNVPISLEDIAIHFQQQNGFAPLRTHLYLSLFRLSEPILEEEIYKYRQDTAALLNLFTHLFGAAQTVYDVIIDEIPVILPKVLSTYDNYYRKTLQHLFFFVQMYPSSPDTKLFIDLFAVLFPDSPVVKELRSWQTNREECVKINLALFPDLLYAMVETPEIFRTFSSLPDGKQLSLPKIPPLLNKPSSKHRVNSGPYHYKMSRWYFILFLAFTLIFPIITTPLLFAQNNRYLHQVNLLIKGHSLIWQLTRAEAFMYPLYYYDSPTSSLWPSPSQYYLFKDQMLAKLRELQLNLTEFSYSTGNDYGDYDKKLLVKVMDFMNKNDIPSFFYNGTSTLYQEFLAFTYIALDLAAANQIYLPVPKRDFTSYDAMKLFVLIRKMLEHDIDIFSKFLSTLDVNVETFLSPKAYLITSLVTLCVSFVIVIWSYISASSNFDLFFMTLRDTSKLIIQQMKQYLRLCISTLMSKYKDHPNRNKKNKKKMKKNSDDDSIKKKKYSPVLVLLMFYVPTVLSFCFLIIFVVLQYLFYNCYNKQCLRMKELYSDYSVGFNGFSTSVTETVLMAQINNASEYQEEELKKSVQSIFDNFVVKTWDHNDDGTSFCPLCTTREIYVLYIPYGITYEKVIFNFIVDLSLVNSISTESPYYADRFISSIRSYYFSIDQTLVGFARRFLDLCANYYNNTKIAQVAVYVLYILLAIGLIIFLIVQISYSDKAFYHIVRLITRFPDSSLAPDTLKILKEKNWQFKAKSFTFDSAFYDVILEALPDAAIVVDQAHTILFFNISAKLIIHTEDAIGKNIFSVMKMNLVSEEENGDFVPFNDIINNYVFGSRDNAVNMELCGMYEDQNQKYWFSFSILPLFNEERRNMANQSGSHRFALIFRDVGDEKRQQSLVQDETKKHLSIIYQILPTQIAERLLVEQKSISMTVQKVAISFCDIVSFTPWCGSQTPESVVNTLNHMFNLFDEKINQYPTMTKIKCIGDCYMSSAGIFSEGVPPSVFGTEMVCFGLDMVSSILVLNQNLGTSLRVRVGAALGGPISAGVMGIHKPVFDIWGDAVNEANGLESSGVPMNVHINQPLYDVIRKELFEINPKGDGTYLVIRKLPTINNDTLSNLPTPKNTRANSSTNRGHKRLNSNPSNKKANQPHSSPAIPKMTLPNTAPPPREKPPVSSLLAQEQEQDQEQENENENGNEKEKLKKDSKSQKTDSYQSSNESIVDIDEVSD